MSASFRTRGEKAARLNPTSLNQRAAYEAPRRRPFISDWARLEGEEGEEEDGAPLFRQFEVRSKFECVLPAGA